MAAGGLHVRRQQDLPFPKDSCQRYESYPDDIDSPRQGGLSVPV